MSEFEGMEENPDWTNFLNAMHTGGELTPDDMRDSGLVPPKHSDTDTSPDMRVDRTLAPSEFNPGQFEGRLPKDEAESIAAAQTLALAHTIPHQTYQSFYDHEYMPRHAPPQGIVAQCTYEGEVYDGVTTARVLTARQELISDTHPEELIVHAVIVETFNEAGEKTGYVRYRSGGKHVYKDSVDLIADNLKPYAHEASAETIRAVARAQTEDRAGMRADAVKAGLMNIPVTLDEVNHLVTLMHNLEPRVFSFGQLYRYIDERIQSSTFDGAALHGQSNIDAYLDAYTIADEARGAATPFNNLVRQVTEYNGVSDSTLVPARFQAVPLNTPTVPRDVLDCHLTTGYAPDTGAPYMRIIRDTIADEGSIELAKERFTEQGMIVPDAFTGREHRAELYITVSEQGYLVMQHRESLMDNQNDRSSIITYVDEEAPADMRLVGYLRNFARKPTYTLHPNIP